MLQRQEDMHRNKVCKFQLYYSSKFRVLRSTKISNAFLYNSKPRDVIKLGPPVGRLAYPTAAEGLIDQLAKDRVIDALDARETRLKVREGISATLEAAASRALQIEAMEEAETRRSRPSRHVRAVEGAAGDNDVTSGQIAQHGCQGTDSQPNSTQPLPRQRSSRICYHSQQEGHFKRDCPELRKKQPGN